MSAQRGPLSRRDEKHDATPALIPVLVIESDATSAGWQRFAEVANWIIWALFASKLAEAAGRRTQIPNRDRRAVGRGA
jgi:hypothetical protein